MRPNVLCIDPECLSPAVSRKMCHKHYLVWWKQTPVDQRPPPPGAVYPPAPDRFWAKVNQDGPVIRPELGPCWIWTGARRPTGHGEFALGGGRGNVPAHSYALELATGEPCPPDKEACHHCDNPPCVRAPRHLYYGTRQQNMDDAWGRGRFPIGEDRPAARLRETQVVELRQRYAAGAVAKELAVEYGIKVVTLRHIVLGLKWKHAAGPITRRAQLTREVP